MKCMCYRLTVTAGVSEKAFEKSSSSTPPPPPPTAAALEEGRGSVRDR